MLARRRSKSLPLFEELAQAAPTGGLEKSLREAGYALIAGADEAGRGPLAGPVVGAAVILNHEADYPGVTDSKALTPAAREKAFGLIVQRAMAVAVGYADAEEIDRLNILEAALRAMSRAVAELAPSPDYVLVDGTFPLPDLALAGNPAQRAVPHGDRLSLTVGAASIVAKVVRDRWMQRYDRLYPAYGFGAHKGYATAAHLAALRLHGPCPIHRKTFAPVRLCSFV